MLVAVLMMIVIFMVMVEVVHTYNSGASVFYRASSCRVVWYL